ncbi:MAG: hypothetical protein HUK25_05745 [Treponema sp.]|nr:hypothetical protein [Treponema sp.]
MDYQKEDNKKSVNKQQKQGFFQNLFENLFNSHSPEVEKRKKLKCIAKDFSKTKFHSFYKTNTGEMLPQFAKLFYEIYKLIFPAQNYLRSIQNKNIFKSQIINYSLSEKQVQLLEHLNEEKIIEMSKKVPVKSIKEKINDELELFHAEFNTDRATRVENLYKAYQAFDDFCSFDFYFMLRKFSSGLQEGNFTTTPDFDKISAEYILEDLQDLITIIYSIPDGLVWDPLFDLLKKMKGAELISTGNWKKILSRLKSIQSSHAMEYIVSLIMQNPKYVPTFSQKNATVLDTYLEKLDAEIYATIGKLESEQKSVQANDYCMKIFGKAEVEPLNYYTTARGAALEKKELNYFEYCDALSYLKAFISSFVKTDIKKYSDIVVIRGQWDVSLSSPFSNGYQELIETESKISKFDDTMAEEGPVGMKIKTLLPKIAHDPGAENIINRLVNDANEEAKGYLISCTQALISMGKLLKQVIEDEQKPKHALIANWKELEKFSEKPLLQFGVEIYKKIYMFVQLIQSYLA